MSLLFFLFLSSYLCIIIPSNPREWIDFITKNNSFDSSHMINDIYINRIENIIMVKTLDSHSEWMFNTDDMYCNSTFHFFYNADSTIGSSAQVDMNFKLTYYKYVRYTLLNKMKEINTNNLYLVGDGIGSIYLLMAAFEIDIPISEIITYNSPRAGNKIFSNYISNKTKYTRIVDRDNKLNYYPKKSNNCQHSGYEWIYFKSTDELYLCHHDKDAL